MWNTAKHVKNRSSGAKRTATAIRELAGSASLDLADRGLLLKAAQVVDSMAARLSSEAKTLKAKEDAYDKALKIATAEAKRLFDLWPAQSTVDKLAIIEACGNTASLNRSIGQEKDTAGSRWAMGYHTEQACREIPDTIAYQSVNKKLPVAELEAAAFAKYQTARSCPEVARRAASIDALLATVAEAA